MGAAPSIPLTPKELLRAVSRDPLAARVADRMQARCGIIAGANDTIVVGCSGGPDSVALVLILATLARRRVAGPEPIVVAVHHGLRSAADAECEQVARLALRLGCRYERVDVTPGARRGNVAANARDDRYAALRDVAVRHGARQVAVAHHADDRFETMLLALARGRGVRGMAAPRWRRTIGKRIALVRPLLDTTKVECVALCDRVGVAWVVDPGNRDSARARGFLRQTAIPSLVDRWPAIARHATRTADEAALAVRAIDRLARRHFGPATVHAWPREVLRPLDQTLVAWALRRSAMRLDPASALAIGHADWERSARAACSHKAGPPRVFRWSGGLRCVIDVREVRLVLETQ